MDRAERIQAMWSMSTSMANKIEDILGEMSPSQKLHVAGLVMAFWAASEDKFHPLKGKWVDLIRDEL